MGVGGNFWDLLKPYARKEGFDFLRNKRVAVDLSFWIVQPENAIKAMHVRKPHLRLTFFRTISLFCKFGALPVFIVDGSPSLLKSRARIARYFRCSGIELANLPVPEEGVSAERNRLFSSHVQECAELVELLGMPVLKAKGEAEALCAQLNSEGHVDACITADSDAFLFGAKCIIKCFCPNSKEPFECYNMSDIEAGLGLKRKHLIAISLLVGDDHDINGVRGIGLDTALHFVKAFSEDDILNRYESFKHWEPAYVRRMMFPMISTIFLRDMTTTTVETTLFGQYEFDSVERVKMRYGYQFFVVKWKRAGVNISCKVPLKESSVQQDDAIELDEMVDLLDDFDAPEIHGDDGCSFLLTDENMDLVGAAFPAEVKRFWQEQELKRIKNSTSRSQENEKSPSPNSRSIQLNITEFYPSTKVKHRQSKQGEESSKNADSQGNGGSKMKRKMSSPDKIPKSVRRRLLFD
ncbi:hypothetical protein JHK85_026876 [Glycine max]|nr:hypothetical protein JHK85_026876 [Glycine max]